MVLFLASSKTKSQVMLLNMCKKQQIHRYGFTRGPWVTQLASITLLI